LVSALAGAIYQVQVKTLSEAGFLAKVNHYPVNVVDTKQLKINSTGADYTDLLVRKHYNDINFNQKLREIVLRLLKAGRKNILVFTRFIFEAQELSDYLGDIAEVVSSATPKKERKAILNNFKNGKIKVVSNVGILTMGFDFPKLETVVLARPTMSLTLYYQMVGRSIRPNPSKECSWVVDLCETYERFGKIEDLELRETKDNLWALYSGGKQLTNVYLN